MPANGLPRGLGAACGGPSGNSHSAPAARGARQGGGASSARCMRRPSLSSRSPRGLRSKDAAAAVTDKITRQRGSETYVPDAPAIGANLISPNIVLAFDAGLLRLCVEVPNVLGIERLDLGISELGADLHIGLLRFACHFRLAPVSGAPDRRSARHRMASAARRRAWNNTPRFYPHLYVTCFTNLPWERAGKASRPALAEQPSLQALDAAGWSFFLAGDGSATRRS
jgi:hypothetical protein